MPRSLRGRERADNPAEDRIQRAASRELIRPRLPRSDKRLTQVSVHDVVPITAGRLVAHRSSRRSSRSHTAECRHNQIAPMRDGTTQHPKL